jgi:hypothetical protein
MASTWSLAVKHAKLNAIAPMFDNGYLRYYGTPQPASPDVPEKSSHLAELRFGKPAFASPDQGKIVAKAISSDPKANGEADAVWVRAFAADGTPLHDAPVEGAKRTIVKNAIVDCPSFVIHESELNGRA